MTSIAATCMLARERVAPEHGIKRIHVLWARSGSDFTLLLFKQAAMSLVRDMPVRGTAIEDDRHPFVEHCTPLRGADAEKLDLSQTEAVAMVETASRRGYRYVMVLLRYAASEGVCHFAMTCHSRARQRRYQGIQCFLGNGELKQRGESGLRHVSGIPK